MSQVQFDENSTEGENQGMFHDICDTESGESLIYGMNLGRDPDAAAIDAFFAQGGMACA